MGGLAITRLEKIIQLAQQLGVPAERQVPLSRYTTFRIGGPAELMLSPENPAMLPQLLRACGEAGLPLFVLGRGSNLLVADEGIPGVILYTGNINQIVLQDEQAIVCGCGALLSKVCDFAAERGLSGLEFAYGIPGTVGGAVYMNAGAYGGEMKDVLLSCDYLDLQGGEGSATVSEMGLDYRRSAFMENRRVIIGAEICLQSGKPEEIGARMREILQKRKDKQPLQFPSAGSAFQRPPGHFAAALIEDCGLKGLQVGGAQVSEKHSGFIVNTGGATAEDVKRLIAQVQAAVFEKTGVMLQPEVQFVP